MIQDLNCPLGLMKKGERDLPKPPDDPFQWLHVTLFHPVCNCFVPFSFDKAEKE